MISLKDSSERAHQRRERKRRATERKEAEQLTAVVRLIVIARKEEVDISPTWVALETMKKLKALDLRQDKPLIYIGCNLYVRQIAREICRRSFEDEQEEESPSIDPSQSPQHELFPGLQTRYPIARPAGDEPVYRLLENLTAEDRLHNINRMETEIKSKQRHVDAFKVFHERRLREESIEPAIA